MSGAQTIQHLNVYPLIDELKRTSTYADGEHNTDLEIEATQNGLELDLGVVIPWDWILHSLSVLLLRQTLTTPVNERRT